MTLKENFVNILYNWIDKDYDREHVSVLLETDVDEFAIDFFNWMRKNDTPENSEKFFHYTDRDMLNTFKEEKEW